MEMRTAKAINAQFVGESEFITPVRRNVELVIPRKITQWGIKIVWGVREPMPIHNAPAGRQRLRMRNKSPVKLFIKTEDGIRCFALEDRGDIWFCNHSI